MEKLKSLLLAILVFTSLLQSYMLVFSAPKFDPANSSDYVQSELIGTQEPLDAMLFPQQIVLHFGDDRHTVLYPHGTFYNMIYQQITQRTFEGFRRSSAQSVLVDWEQVQREHQGVEIRFQKGVPITILQRMMRIRGEAVLENEMITRIWFYMREDKEELKTFFFTENPNVLYEVTKADLNIKDLERFIGFGHTEYQPNYFSIGGSYYLPDEYIPVYGFRIPYGRITADQMQYSLFVDPSNTRNFIDREGAEIYTDGKRGLQVKPNQLWMSYSDPVPPAEAARNDVTENLLSAVQFVNMHGGWNGRFIASRMGAAASGGQQTLTFQQYADFGLPQGAFPIIADPSNGFGLIKLVLQKGIVSGYERSLIIPDYMHLEARELRIPGGEDLRQRIVNHARSSEIRTVFPAYRPVIYENYVDLIPGWALLLPDDVYEFLY